MVIGTEPRNAGRFVQAGDVRLHCIELGEPTGLPIVWLHGGGPGASSWSNFHGNVADFGSYRNVLLDLPQFGRSDKPIITGPRVAYLAARVAAALDALGVSSAHLIGNSLGGVVATKVAIDRPDLVDRLVVMGGAGGHGSGPTQGMEQLMEIRRAGPTRAALADLLRLMVHDESLVTDELVDARYEASLDEEAVRAQASAPPAEDGTGDLPRVAAPTLLLWGREDRFVSLESALVYLRGIPDAQLVVYPRCGHWVQVERRAEFARAVGDFLAGPR